MYIGYLNDRLSLGYNCQKDLESITVANEMLKLTGIEQISIWYLEPYHNPPFLKKRLVEIILVGEMVGVLLGGNPVKLGGNAESTFFPPINGEAPIERVIQSQECRALLGNEDEVVLAKQPGEVIPGTHAFGNQAPYHHQRPGTPREARPGTGRPVNPKSGSGIFRRNPIVHKFASQELQGQQRAAENQPSDSEASKKGTSSQDQNRRVSKGKSKVKNGGNGNNGNGGSGSGNGSETPSETCENSSNTKGQEPETPTSNDGRYSKKQKKKKQQKQNRVLTREETRIYYNNYIQSLQKEGLDTQHITEERFIELSTNSKTNEIREKLLEEAEVILKAETKKHIPPVERVDNPDVKLDFQAQKKDPQTGRRVYYDAKAMIDFQSLEERGIDISNFPSLEDVAYKMGADSVEQKSRFLEKMNPIGQPSDVIHVCSFKNIRDVNRIPALIEAVLEGAKAEGMANPETGFLFLQ